MANQTISKPIPPTQIVFLSEEDIQSYYRAMDFGLKALDKRQEQNILKLLEEIYDGAYLGMKCTFRITSKHNK